MTVLGWIFGGLIVLYLISCPTCGRRVANWYVSRRIEIADSIVLNEKRLKVVWWVTIFLWLPTMIFEGATDCAFFRMSL